MIVKIKDLEFKIKDMNTAGFQKQIQSVKIDYLKCQTKYITYDENGQVLDKENLLAGFFAARNDFFYPEVNVKLLTPEQRNLYGIPADQKDGRVTVARFKELFTLFLDGDLSNVDFSNTIENTVTLREVGDTILNFLMYGLANSTED